MPSCLFSGKRRVSCSRLRTRACPQQVQPSQALSRNRSTIKSQEIHSFLFMPENDRGVDSLIKRQLSEIVDSVDIENRLET